jgi:hypothetical protein
MREARSTAKGLQPRRGRGLVAVVVSLILVASSVASAWVLLDSGLLGVSAAPVIDGPLAAVVDAVPLEEATGAILIVDSAQISQPRDPFRPLVTEDSPIFGVPGVGGTPGGAGTPGDDGDGFTPTTTISLVEVRDVGGVLRATVTVNGESFDVGAGETFAGSYRVVSLTEDMGVFMFGDNAFQLSVGQQILK